MARTFRHECFRCAEHVDRLFRSLKHGFRDRPHPRNARRPRARAKLEHNARLVPQHHDLGVSMFITAGNSLIYSGYDGMATHKAHRLRAYLSLPFELWAEKYTAGQHVVTPSIRHLPPECLDPGDQGPQPHKIGIFGRRTGRREWSDPKAIALLLDRQDNITFETSTANFFIVHRGASSPRPVGTPCRGSASRL